MDIETFKYSKLIAIVKRLGSSQLYDVSLAGMGDHFQAVTQGASHKEAAEHVLEELTFAAHHPHKFFNRKKLAAQEIATSNFQLQQMIDLANEAVEYADKNKKYLSEAVISIDEHTSRKIGS